VSPVSLDQYPPDAGIGPSFLFIGYPCRSTAPFPAPPYANPESYYGFPLVQPASDSATEKKDAGDSRYPAEKK
jgi:hypothetical protein